MESVLSAAQAQLDALGAQIEETAARERNLQGRVLAWSDAYTAAADRVERLLLRRRSVSSAFETTGGDATRLHSLLWARSKLSRRLHRAERVRAVLAAQSPPLDELFQVETLMRQLDRARRKALRIVSALQAAQQNPALASLAVAVQGASAVSYGDWARQFLGAVGVPACQNNLTTVVAWQAAEYTQAGWNPLATTYPMAGATSYNGAGVRNYVSLQQGLQASVLTLRTGSPSYGYDWIVYRLATCAAPEVTAGAINASLWCRGCAGGAYVTGLVPRVEAAFALYARL